MTRLKRLSLAAILLASASFLLPACGKKAPVADMPTQNFRLPAHFEQRLAANDTVMIPVGSSALITFTTLYKNAGVVNDLRPFESAITIGDLPAGVTYRHLSQYHNLKKAPNGVIQAVNVVRLDLENVAVGQSFQIEGTAELRDAFIPDQVLDSQNISQTVVVVAYEPDMEMVQGDRAAALFYLENSLYQYDQLTKKGHQVPWEPAELAALMDDSNSDTTAINQLWKSRVRVEEARRHLNAAANASDQDVVKFAKEALQDVDKAFEEWKKNGVPRHKKEKPVTQLFAENKLDRRYATMNMPKEEGFNSNINIPTIARPWLTPISMGLQLESRFGALGTTNHRSTALTETLSGQLAIHDYFWVAVRLPMYSMRSQADGAKWTTGMLNPAVTLGTGYVQREHWRVRLEVEFMPNIGQSKDMAMFEYFITEMPGAATAGHVLSLNPSVELAASQFTLAVLTGVQLAITDSGLDSWFRYAVVGGVWLHKRFALQLDGRGRVQMNGEQHLSYGTFGFSGLINIHDNWNLELGVTTPLGDNKNLSSMQFYLTFGCARWGTLTGKMKSKKK